MPVNLLSYQGNAGLGLGAGSTPTTPTNPELSVINNTIRDVMLLDNQKNISLFQQKIRDRDALTEMISKNQVSSGDILPEYRQHFDEAEKRAEKAFTDWGGNFNDKDGYRKYQAAITDLKDISTHAQAKTLSMRELEKEKAQQILPRKQADYDKWIQRQKAEPFWSPVTPYQQLHDFSIDDILKGVKPFTREVQDPSHPNDPTFKVNESYIDFNDILRNKKNQYINDQDAADSIDQFFDKIQRLAPHQLGTALDAIDTQIDKYNTDRGFVAGQPGYVPKVNRATVNGQIMIQEPKAEFAAKYALANEGQFVTRSQKFDKDLAKYGIDKAKLQLAGKKLGIDATKAGAYIRNLDAKTKKFVASEQATGTNISRQYEDFVNGIKPLNTIEKKTGRTVEKLNAVYVDRLPQSYQFINGPVIALDKAGKPSGKITVGKLEPFISTDRSKRPYYLTRYVNSTTGDDIGPDSDFVNGTYNTWKKSGYQGSKEDMLKTLLKNGAVEMVLQGKNGAANYTSMYQSAKTLNAAATTKGEENIINPPEEIPQEQPEE